MPWPSTVLDEENAADRLIFNSANADSEPPLYFSRVHFDLLFQMYTNLVAQLFPDNTEEDLRKEAREKVGNKGGKGAHNRIAQKKSMLFSVVCSLFHEVGFLQESLQPTCMALL